LQGHACYLGSFSDPISAARRYDKEATKLRGAAAVLNFPPGPKFTPARIVVQSQPRVLPGGRACGRKRATITKPLPAGNTSSNLAAVPEVLRTKEAGHRVSFDFLWWEVRHGLNRTSATPCSHVGTVNVSPDDELLRPFTGISRICQSPFCCCHRLSKCRLSRNYYPSV
jgi:hypothetical protein